MRGFFKVLFMVAVAAVIFYGGKKYSDNKIEELFIAARAGLLTPEQTSARTAQALLLSRGALERIAAPNVYGFISSSTLESSFRQSAAAVLAHTTVPEGFEVLELKPDTISLDIGVIKARFKMRGRLASPNLAFDGAVEVMAAPAFDGASVVLLPLAIRPTIDTVSLWDLPWNLLPGVAENVLGSTVGVAVAATSRIAIPLQLGLTENFDLADALRERKELVAVSSPPVAIRQAFSELALLASPAGLAFVGEAKTIPKLEYDAALIFLRGLAEKIQTALPPCEDCALRGLDVDAYFTCMTNSWRCRANRSLGANAGGDRVLNTVEMLALHDLRDSKEPSDRAVYQRLQPLLAPRIAGESLTGWDPARLRELFTTLHQRVAQLRASVDVANEFPNLGTGLIVRRDYLGRLVNDSLSGVEVAVELKVPQQPEQQIDPEENEIKTDNAPDLKCAENAGGCDSNFDYPGFHRGGCDSDCMTRKCVWGICADVPDLGCTARKAACELTREKERLEHEVRRAAAHAEFIRKKIECEAVREMKLTACEINQGWLRTTANMPLGRISGNYRVNEATASAKKLSASVGDRFSSVTIRGNVGGSAKIGADIVYTPLGAGHVICVSQWGGPLKAEVQLQPVDFSIEGTLDEAATAAAGNALVFRVAEQKVKLKMSPPPGLALVTQTPQVALACPVPAAIFTALPGVAGPAGHLVQVHLLLKDEFEQTIPAREIRIPLAREGSGVAVHVGRQVVAIAPAAPQM